MRFGMFFLNEYAGLTIMSMVAVALFFGAWEGPGVDLWTPWGVSVLGFVWFMVKTYVLVFVLIWIRLSIPRLQVDQLMGFAWKFLIPLGLLNIMASAAIILWAPSWKYAMAGFNWVLFLGMVGGFDKALRWRLRRQRRKAPVLT
jgi:NADH:ubiquinone oxidoreductase subunit H